jgi:hypothetical protein
LADPIGMITSTASASRVAVAVLLAAIVLGAGASGCSAASDTAAASGGDDPAMPSRGDAPEAMKAPAVGGPASGGELTDALGVFVAAAPAGQAGASGSHDHPLSSIQDAIDLGTRVGKRVYVCAGRFHEALSVADSVAIIGGLDCTGNEWHLSDARTRIDAPSSPAIRALGITAVTRIEGFEIYAPNASSPSGSSIALVADHAPGLVIARTKLVAGNASAGADGVDGIQLVASPHNAEPATTAASCATGGNCPIVGAHYVKSSGAHGGTNSCSGAPGHTAEAGGNGGSGGIWEPLNDLSAFHFHPYQQIAANGADLGVPRTAAPGVDGAPGANAAPLGTFSRDGYAPARGTPGSNGAPGSGGSGGAGRSPEPDYDPNTAAVKGVWRGFGGAGGGAGGCPGLAGTAGDGGGASIAALLVESPVTFDGAELESGSAGGGGRGAFGSMPTAGGIQGINVFFVSTNGQPGGRGGAAGISGNGSNGPTAGIAVSGSKPIVGPTTTIKPGIAAPAIPARNRTTLDFTSTIPGTPAGRAEQMLVL